MSASFEVYLDQLTRWPAAGNHILASYDVDTIVVYQAYAADIASHAVANQRFGGRFTYQRMSWIKPGFLWMMFRSGWAAKEGQERVLAVRLSRRFFDELLALAVPSSFAAGGFATHAEWRYALRASDVRLQWDPDHDPAGRKQQRRSLQLGLRGEALRCYGMDEIREITDITPFVREQRANAANGSHHLLTPREDVYLPADAEVRRKVGIDE